MRDIYNDEFLNLLRNESHIEIDDESLLLLLADAQECLYQRNEYIMKPDVVETDLLVVKDGLFRLSYIEHDEQERTIGFAGSGTITISPLGYLLDKPAFFYEVACTDCSILRVKRKDVEAALRKAPHLAEWLLGIAFRQFAAIELKHQFFGGSTKEKYKEVLFRRDLDLMKRYYISHREIVNVVSEKVLASYLGIHPVSLSRIKRELINEERSANKNKTK